MRRLSLTLLLLFAMLSSALPALADDGDPLARAVLLDGMIGWALVGLAILLMLLFILFTRRGPN